MIHLLKPNIPKPIKWLKYLKKSYSKNIFSNNGPCVQKLEEELKKYIGLKNTPILISNATIALEIALRSLNIDPDSEVLVPNFTFSATAHSVINAKLKPILVDCEKDTFISLNEAKKKINKKTKVIIVVQSLGYSCDYKKYEKFAKKNKLKLIFDSAACLGGKYLDGNKIGGAGDIEIFSLHATKTFGIGEGGLICSNNNKILSSCRKQINFGFINFKAVGFGTNAKMSEIQASVGLSVLDIIEKKMLKRKKIANMYEKYLKELPVHLLANETSAHQVFPVIFKNKATRDDVKKELDKNNIGNRIYYIPLHIQPYFKVLKRSDKFNNSTYLYERILCIPMHEFLNRKEIKIITDIIKEVVRK